MPYPRRCRHWPLASVTATAVQAWVQIWMARMMKIRYAVAPGLAGVGLAITYRWPPPQHHRFETAVVDIWPETSCARTTRRRYSCILESHRIPYKYCAIIYFIIIFFFSFPTSTYFKEGPRLVAGRHCDASAPISKRMASRVAEWPYSAKVKWRSAHSSRATSSAATCTGLKRSSSKASPRGSCSVAVLNLTGTDQ